MTKSTTKTLFVLVLTCLSFSCRDEQIDPDKDNAKLIQGSWNNYEYGTEQIGFTPEITTSLTMFYESGIAFSSDGTFRTRHHINGTWTEAAVAIGTYELKGKTITLLHSTRPDEENKLEIQLVKLDEKHLWFKHSFFVETEYHLERVTN